MIKFRGLTLNDWGFLSASLKKHPELAENRARLYQLKSKLAGIGYPTGNKTLLRKVNLTKIKLNAWNSLIVNHKKWRRENVIGSESRIKNKANVCTIIQYSRRP